jgi:hypothetical protein
MPNRCFRHHAQGAYRDQRSFYYLNGRLDEVNGSAHQDSCAESTPSVILLVSGSKLASKSSFFISNLGHRGRYRNKRQIAVGLGGRSQAVADQERCIHQEAEVVGLERHSPRHLPIDLTVAAPRERRLLMRNSAVTPECTRPSTMSTC